MNRRNFFVSTSAAAAGLTALVVFAQTKPKAAPAASKLLSAAAVNIAGRQRMLSQRMGKTYAQLGLGVLPERSLRILAESRDTFSKQLRELTEFAPTAEIVATYNSLDKLWLPYRKLLETTPTAKTGAEIQVLNEEILKVADQGVLQLEKHAATSLGKLVNVSGRQRMLSQRTAKFFMFREWGLPKPIEADLAVARKEFKAALATLRSAPETTPAIKQQLQLAEKQWLFFEGAIDASMQGKADFSSWTNVASTSERILEVFEGVTGAYERLGTLSAG
jgi:nitrate/nitrite-specific signal transduction histidine kinase